MAPSTTGSRSGSPLIVVTQHKPWRAQGFCTVQRCRVAAGLPVPAHAELAVVAVPAAAVRVLQAETLGAEPTHKAPNSCRPTRPEISINANACSCSGARADGLLAANISGQIDN